MRHQNASQSRLVSTLELVSLDADRRDIKTDKRREQQPLPPRAPKAPLVSRNVIVSLVRLGESLLTMGMAFAIWALYVREYATPDMMPYVSAIVATGIALPLVLQLSGLYTVHALLNAVDNIASLGSAWVALFAAILTLVVFSKSGADFSRVWLAAWFLAGLGALIAFRIFVCALMRRWNANGQLDRRAVIVGGGAPAEALISALDRAPHTDIQIVGLFDDRMDDRSPDTVAGYPKLGRVSELLEFAREQRVDLLIVTLPLSAESRLLQLLKKLWVLPVDIRLSAYAQQLRYRPRAYSYIGNVPFIDVSDKPLSDWDGVVKAIEDKVIATLALAALLPVMLLVALAIKLDSRGPVLFKQRRYGFNNELIEVYKFRSMYTDRTDADAVKLVTKDDPRVTRVGRFIRKTSLDELPQLLNVLKGDLSLVGPRPHATHAKAKNRLYGEVVDGYFARHKVKPGITGWAQINGWRGETDTEEKIERRVEHDLYYIENWSLLFDLYILLRTPFALLKTEQAY